MVRDILSEDGLPYLPELPARGPGADMVGRAAGLLVDLRGRPAADGLAVRRPPGPRRVAHRLAVAGGPRRAGRGLRRLHRRAQAAGRRPLDPGLVGVAAPRRACGRRPGRHPRPRRLAGRGGAACTSPRSSGWCPAPGWCSSSTSPACPPCWPAGCPPPRATGVLRAVDPQVAAAGLRDVLAAAGERRTAIHCCAPDLNWPLLRGTGAARARRRHHRCWARAAGSRSRRRSSRGSRCGPACLPTDGSRDHACRATVGPLVDRWREVGLPRRRPRRRDRDADVRAGRTHTRAGPRAFSEMAADTARALTETAGS